MIAGRAFYTLSSVLASFGYTSWLGFCDDVALPTAGRVREYSWDRLSAGAFEWAARFEALAREWMLSADFAPLVNYTEQGSDVMKSIPTPDHYLPLLYVLAQHDTGDRITFPVEGFDGGSMSMLAVQCG